MKGKEEFSKALSPLANRVRGLLLGDRIYLEHHYQNLYGVNQEEKARVVLDRNRKRGITASLILILLLAFYILGESQNHKMFLYDEEESRGIIGMNRPESGMLQENITARIEKGEWYWTSDFSAKIPSLSMMEQKKEASKPESLKEEEEIRRQVELLIREAIARPGNQVILPTHTREGTAIRWEPGGSKDQVYLLASVLLIGWMLYSSRYSGLKMERAEASRSVQGDLPLFLNQLVLLLNAGSIFEGAFMEILKNENHKKKNTYFYHQMELIRIRYEETRDPLDAQLAAFARRTDDQDFIRIAGIIRDNLHRGILLSEKLLKERNDLMHKRKKKAEEEIRVKETRLTMPLCLYLIVLIGIAIGPAVLSS